MLVLFTSAECNCEKPREDEIALDPAEMHEHLTNALAWVAHGRYVSLMEWERISDFVVEIGVRKFLTAT